MSEVRPLGLMKRIQGSPLELDAWGLFRSEPQDAFSGRFSFFRTPKAGFAVSIATHGPPGTVSREFVTGISEPCPNQGLLPLRLLATCDPGPGNLVRAKKTKRTGRHRCAYLLRVERVSDRNRRACLLFFNPDAAAIGKLRPFGGDYLDLVGGGRTRSAGGGGRDRFSPNLALAMRPCWEYFHSLLRQRRRDIQLRWSPSRDAGPNNPAWRGTSARHSKGGGHDCSGIGCFGRFPVHQWWGGLS